MISYRLNPSLIVSELAGSGFAIYAPPEPTPCRIKRDLWLALSRLKHETKSLPEWNKYLSALDLQFDFQDLLDKKIILPLEIKDDEANEGLIDYSFSVDSENSNPRQSAQSSSHVGESISIKLFRISPVWPNFVKCVLLNLLWLQFKFLPITLLVVVGYLLFYLLAPVSGGSLFFNSTSELNGNFDVLFRVLIGLLTVNLFSTFTTWMAQSLTGKGDGWIVLRFIFGIIPRFGVHAYSGSALRSTHWSAESNNALLCIAQPLLSRLSLAFTLILLISSGRLQGNLEGSHLYSLANVVLQISLISFCILALPFRMSPGYRLMILFTDLPPSTLGQSVSKLYTFCSLFIDWYKSKDSKQLQHLKEFLSLRSNVGLVLFASAFILLILAKLAIILYLAIPRLATGLPELFGAASKYIFTILLLFLLIRFLKISIVPKFKAVKENSLLRLDNSLSKRTDQKDLVNPSRNDAINLLTVPKYWLPIVITGAALLFPINRTITGSVVVSNERDLTVRASDDVRVLSVFQRGPSSQIIPKGTRLIRLESSQLERDLFQVYTQIIEYQKSLDTLKAEYQTIQNLLHEINASLASYEKSIIILNGQIDSTRRLSEIGALSQQSAQELLLKLYEYEEQERLKAQQKIELESDLQDISIKIKASEVSLKQSKEWQSSLLMKEKNLLIHMPFDGLITSMTSGLMGSFFSKGETILDLREGSLNFVNVLVPDHDRSLIKVGQNAVVRLYAEPNKSLSALVHSIRPSSDSIDQKVYFQVSLRLLEPLNPNLLQSSGAARVNGGDTNLLLLTVSSIGRFINVDVWSWTP